MTTPISNEGSDTLNNLFKVDDAEEQAVKKKTAQEKLLKALQDPTLADAVYDSLINPDDDGGPLGLLNMYRSDTTDEVNTVDPGSPSNLLFTKGGDNAPAA